MEDALGLQLGETSKDGAVSLEAVYCLGFCNAGPTVEVEGRIYGELTPDRARALGHHTLIATISARKLAPSPRTTNINKNGFRAMPFNGIAI